MKMARVALVTTIALGLSALTPGFAGAAVQITRAELKGGQLRVEGTASPNATVLVDGGAASGQADPAGAFRIETANFSSPTCVITVSDGSPSAAKASLAGCTPSAP